MAKEYELRFLPLFEEDLNEIVDYIKNVLQNEIAAFSFVDAVEKAIRQRLPFAESFEKYQSTHDRKYPYYQIPVKNYTIFYVVIGNTMEIRRILYGRSNWKERL